MHHMKNPLHCKAYNKVSCRCFPCTNPKFVASSRPTISAATNNSQPITRTRAHTSTKMGRGQLLSEPGLISRIGFQVWAGGFTVCVDTIGGSCGALFLITCTNIKITCTKCQTQPPPAQVSNTTTTCTKYQIQSLPALSIKHNHHLHEVSNTIITCTKYETWPPPALSIKQYYMHKYQILVHTTNITQIQPTHSIKIYILTII